MGMMSAVWSSDDAVSIMLMMMVMMTMIMMRVRMMMGMMSAVRSSFFYLCQGDN